MPLTTTARVYDTPPDAPVPVGPPDRRNLLGEWRTGAQVARLAASAPALARAPRGDGRPVLLVPGWRAPESSMAPLRWYLARLGHDARHWGLGVNEGDPERDAARVAARVEALAGATGRAVSLVGWSLGGTIAREVARRVPRAVRRVVTYGTPTVGGPSYTMGAATYGPAESARISALIDELDRETPITAPITAIFTRRDGVVTWTACLDRRSPTVRHVEVSSTHLGMGIDPDVWLVVAEDLAPGR